MSSFLSYFWKKATCIAQSTCCFEKICRKSWLIMTALVLPSVSDVTWLSLPTEIPAFSEELVSHCKELMAQIILGCFYDCISSKKLGLK